MPQKARPRFDGDQWTIYHAGRRHYLCKGAANEAHAWTLALQITGLPADLDRPPRSVVQAVDAWLLMRGNSWHELLLRPFLRFAGTTPLNRVHLEYLNDYKAHLETIGYIRQVTQGSGEKARKVKLQKPYSASAMRRQISLAHRVLEWAHRRGYMTQSPPELPRLPQPPEVDRSLNRDQVAKLFAAVPKKAGDILRFIALTGCRPDEACQLIVDEIRGEVCELRRGKTFTRTGRPRVLYLSPAAAEIIQRQKRKSGYVFLNRDGKAYQPSGLRSIIRRAGERAGIAIAGTYQLRHSYAQAALHTITLDEVGELLGHVPGSRSTRIYARIKADRALNAAKSLDGLVSHDQQPPAHPATAPAKRTRRKADAPTPAETSTRRSRQAG